MPSEDTMSSHEAAELQKNFDLVAAYIYVHTKRCSGLADAGLLPAPKKAVKAALDAMLSREERSSIDDELMRGVYLVLSEYQPSLESIVAEEKARLLRDLGAFPVKPVPREVRERIAEMFGLSAYV